LTFNCFRKFKFNYISSLCHHDFVIIFFSFTFKHISCISKMKFSLVFCSYSFLFHFHPKHISIKCEKNNIEKCSFSHFSKCNLTTLYKLNNKRSVQHLLQRMSEKIFRFSALKCSLRYDEWVAKKKSFQPTRNVSTRGGREGF
jgi:hypothetical protein